MISDKACERHGRIRCSECAYIEELESTIEELKGELKNYEGCKGIESYYAVSCKLRDRNAEVERYRTALAACKKQVEDHNSQYAFNVVDIVDKALGDSHD